MLPASVPWCKSHCHLRHGAFLLCMYDRMSECWVQASAAGINGCSGSNSPLHQLPAFRWWMRQLLVHQHLDLLARAKLPEHLAQARAMTKMLLVQPGVGASIAGATIWALSMHINAEGNKKNCHDQFCVHHDHFMKGNASLAAARAQPLPATGRWHSHLGCLPGMKHRQELLRADIWSCTAAGGQMSRLGRWTDLRMTMIRRHGMRRWDSWMPAALCRAATLHELCPLSTIWAPACAASAAA